MLETYRNRPLPIGVFGELITSNLIPVVQISNKYQNDPANMSNMEVFSATGGSVDNDSNKFRCQTGTSIGGYGVTRSKETLNYHAGQGIEAKFTASFTQGVPLSIQFAGMFTVTDTIAFGFDGEDFSALHSYGGISNVEEIEVTATGAGTCTVQLDGDSVGIAVTNSDTETNAEEIRAGLFADPTIGAKWRFEQVGSKCFCIANNVGVKAGAMSISGGVTATITQNKTGTAKTDNHTPQSNFNLPGAPFEGFDPTKLNIYKITLGYLGVANIIYSIYNPAISDFVDVHTIEWANQQNITTIINPNLKIGWTSASLGSSGTNLTVEGASAELSLQGDNINLNDVHSSQGNKTSVGSANDINILTIRNRTILNNLYNLAKVFPLRVSASNDHNKPIIISIYKNATISGTQNYSYHDEYDSAVSVDTSGDVVTGTDLIDSFSVGASGASQISLSDLDTDLLPDETLTFAARADSGSASSITITATWKEEK